MINIKKIAAGIIRGEVYKEKRDSIIKNGVCQRCDCKFDNLALMRRKTIEKILEDLELRNETEITLDIDMFFRDYILVCKDCCIAHRHKLFDEVDLIQIKKQNNDVFLEEDDVNFDSFDGTLM